MPVAAPITAEEFLAEPPPLPDMRHVELVAGEVVVNSPLMIHEVIQMRIWHALVDWIRDGRGSGRPHCELDSRLDSANVYKPDVMWYSEARKPDVRSLSPYPLPDLAVEVRSDSTWCFDIGAKKSAYERFGLTELWLVDLSANEEVLVFRRSVPGAPLFDVTLVLGAADVIESPQLPGFSLAVGALFELD